MQEAATVGDATIATYMCSAHQLLNSALGAVNTHIPGIIMVSGTLTKRQCDFGSVSAPTLPLSVPHANVISFFLDSKALNQLWH